jgi:hypothetical protein
VINFERYLRSGKKKRKYGRLRKRCKRNLSSNLKGESGNIITVAGGQQR